MVNQRKLKISRRSRGRRDNRGPGSSSISESTERRRGLARRARGHWRLHRERSGRGQQRIEIVLGSGWPVRPGRQRRSQQRLQQHQEEKEDPDRILANPGFSAREHLRYEEISLLIGESRTGDLAQTHGNSGYFL